MRHTINTTIHAIGGLVLLWGILMGVKAAGLAALGGDFAEMAALCKCSLAASACGGFLQWWRV